MQSVRDPYIVTRDGGTDERPRWRIFCVVDQPKLGDPLYEPGLISEAEFEALIWRKGTGFSSVKRTARAFCLTDLFQRFGWQRIGARDDWKTGYLSVEWWHFQNETGLVAHKSTFGDELRMIYPANRVDQSGLALDAVWTGTGSFATRSGSSPLPQENVGWAQVILNAVAGERLRPDGDLGSKTRDALRRFQQRELIAQTGTIDATTEIALLQRGLEHIAQASLFGSIGTMDDRTITELQRFQQGAGTNTTGVLDSATRQAFRSAFGRLTPGLQVR
jgi:hypothetical protein